MFKLGRRRSIGRQSFIMHGRQQMFPHEAQNALHVVQGRVTCDRDHGLLIWHYDTKLSKGTVAAESVMATAPELIGVALLVIGAHTTIRFDWLLYFKGGGFLDPL